MGGINSNDSRNSQILVVGFERSGKSLLLKKLIEMKTPDLEGGTLESTKAFDYVRIKVGNTFYDFWELGGSDISRMYWPTFYQNLKFGFVFYMINIFDFSSHNNSLRELSILANEEELKQAKFIIIFNMILDEKNIQNNEAKIKYATEIRDGLITVLRESPIHDYDTRISSILIDISKLKEKETKTEEFLNLFKLT